MRYQLAVFLFAALAATACSDASGVVRGGDLLVVDPCAANGTSSSWQDLYACFFGPTGKASCSSQGTCHSDGQTGAKTSGFVCGPSKQGCWEGMTTGTCTGSEIPPCPIVPAGGTPSFKSTGLYHNLRKASGGGTMPNDGSYIFTDSDMARIGKWITAGAQNN